MKIRIQLLWLMISCLLSFLCAAELTFNNWQVLMESKDESRYRLTLEQNFFEAVELRWYGVSSPGSVANDRVTFICYDGSDRPVAAFRCGRENDNIDNLTGWHIAYLILPHRTSLRFIEVRLSKPNSNPRLITKLSHARAFNCAVNDAFQPLHYEGKVSYSAYDAFSTGKVWMHAAGLGTIWGWGAPQKASIDYVIFRSFSKPSVPAGFSSNPDVYFDVAYAGTINVVGEGWTGQGGYSVAIAAGLGQGFSINQVLSRSKVQLLFKSVSHSTEGYIQDLLQNYASGITDIIIDVVEMSQAGYLKFALESMKLVATLFEIDEKIAKASTLIFENLQLPYTDRVHLWLRLKATVAAAGLAHSVLSFYTDGTVEGDLNGNRGLKIGPALLHYRGPRSPEVLDSSLKDGSTEVSLQPQIKLSLSSNVSRYDGSKILLRKVGTNQSVPTNVSIQGSTVTLSPRSSLEGNTLYELIVQQNAFRDSSNVGNLNEFRLTFTTGSPLIVVNTSIRNGESNVPIKPSIKFVFNKTCTLVRRDAIVLKKSTGEYVTDASKGANVSLSNNELTVSFSSPLAVDQPYVLEIQSGALKDSSGNPNLAFSLNFKTASFVKVVSTDPADKQRDVPTSKSIVIRFDRNIKPGPAFNNVQLKSLNQIVAIDKSISGASLVIRPRQNLEINKDYSITVPQHAVLDSQTDAPNLTYSFSFTSAVPPQIVKSFPPNGATNVYRDQVVWIIFSEGMKKGTNFSQMSVKVNNNPVSFDSRVEFDTLTISFRSVLTANSNVMIQIPRDGLVDLQGNPMQQVYVLSFTTGSVASPPEIFWTSPRDSEENVALNSFLYVKFNKKISQGPNWEQIVLKTEAGQTVQIQKLISYETQLEIRPLERLKPNTVYLLTLPAGCVVESTGATFQSTTIIKFRTEYRSGTM
uniref:SbsA Ig-like domain-containing protein n=1 Tax=Pseudothermotoga hypogea TaxID=57487 RepID=A0A832I754_9THEM